MGQSEETCSGVGAQEPPLLPGFPNGTGGLMENAALPAEHRQLFQKVRYKKKVASFLRNFTVGER